MGKEITLNKNKGNTKLLTYDELSFLLNKYDFKIENDEIIGTYKNFQTRLKKLYKDRKDVLNFSRKEDYERTGFVIDVDTKEIYIKGVKKYNYNWNLIILQQVKIKLLFEDINWLDYEMPELYDKYNEYYYKFLKEKGI